MEDNPYYLEVIFDRDQTKLAERVAYVTERFPYLKELPSGSRFFMIMEYRPYVFSEEDKAFLNECFEQFYILRWRCKSNSAYRRRK